MIFNKLKKILNNKNKIERNKVDYILDDKTNHVVNNIINDLLGIDVNIDKDLKKVNKKGCKHLKKPLKFIRNIYGDEINQLNARSLWECTECGSIITRDYLYDSGKISDGYHTFNELYDHRTMLLAVICNNNPSISWKSNKHSDDRMYQGMFIVGIDTPEGQITYHVNLDKWDLFDIYIRERAPEFDGHTSQDVLHRLKSLF